MDEIYKGKTREEIIELIYNLHLQNTNGRESPDEMFKLGIEAAYDEMCDFSREDIEFSIQMTDMNGIEIAPGHKIVYQKGKTSEVTCDIVERNGVIYFANWSDGGEDVRALDFWFEPTDNKITEIIN